jgi:hypothetical protein
MTVYSAFMCWLIFNELIALVLLQPLPTTSESDAGRRDYAWTSRLSW